MVSQCSLRLFQSLSNVWGHAIASWSVCWHTAEKLSLLYCFRLCISTFWSLEFYFVLSVLQSCTVNSLTLSATISLNFGYFHLGNGGDCCYMLVIQIASFTSIVLKQWVDRVNSNTNASWLLPISPWVLISPLQPGGRPWHLLIFWTKDGVSSARLKLCCTAELDDGNVTVTARRKRRDG